MKLKRRVRSLLQWLIVCIGIGGNATLAQDTNRQHLMEKAGALIWEMIEVETDFGHRRSNRDMTPAKVEKYARKVAGQLARARDRLARLHRDLPSGDGFGDDLATFLKRWPDEAAFYDSLFAENVSHVDHLGAQLYGLGSQAHDTRNKWTTPFPFFRP